MNEKLMKIEQVGGHHYASGFQHWDLIEKYDIDYLAGNATAYILRFDRKGTPREDLLKAKSYLDRMMLAERGVRRRAPFRELQDFSETNALSPRKRHLFDLILGQGHPFDIKEASDILGTMAKEYS